jgi:magnesium-transporting ATPase (P-type)
MDTKVSFPYMLPLTANSFFGKKWSLNSSHHLRPAAAVIAGVVLINALIGFVQEGKAEKALDAIRDMLSPQATVFRDGTRSSLPAEQLVPGDVVFLQSGDKFPADVRLLKTKNLRVDEASLTGESVPVEKTTAPVSAGSPLGDRTCMAYTGTLVTYGQANGIVAATGDHTELGKIDALIALAPPTTTRLLLKMVDDNFASIEHAVEEGRTVYDNIKKALMFILPTNGGEAGMIVAAILFGRMLPFQVRCCF